jgi:hypothetical protein
MTGGKRNLGQISDVFTVLTNARRSHLVAYLALFGYERDIEARHLARVVGSIESGIPPRSVTTEQYESVYNSLIQTHLPKLHELNIVTYDERAKTVTVNAEIGFYALLLSLTRYEMTAGNWVGNNSIKNRTQ